MRTRGRSSLRLLRPDLRHLAPAVLLQVVPRLVQPAVEQGKVVFVDITADWCLTCKANKRLVIDTDDVQQALSQPHVVRMQGDWTRQDEVIGDYLRSYGKFGIPFNIVYGPAAPQGIVLPELLTARAVTDAIINATGE